MKSDAQSAENPYSPPSVAGAPSRRSRVAAWLLLGLALFFIALSLPIAWHTLELANQEHLHIWNSRRAIYDIQFNGTPVTNDDAIWHGTITVLIQWTIAAGLIVGARLLGRSSRVKRI